ncbi:MAG: prepilin peptidase [Chloroflexota bacterium]|nr:prepilin peptidase [Chloroflexota bacterium]
MILIYALFGLAVGSFLNVCIDRLPQTESLLSPPSHCSSCGHRLSALDLIPLLSYLLLRGRCRYCGAPIPWRLPLVELATGSLFALLWSHYDSIVQLALATIYACFFVVIFVIDLEHRLVLNRVIYPAIALALLAVPFTPNHDLKTLIGGGAAGFALLFVIALIRPAGMGMGDVKLATFIGLIVGFPSIFIALFLAFVAGGIVGGGLLLTGSKGRKDPVPFAPFVVVGGMAAMLYGEEIVDWYLRCWL